MFDVRDTERLFEKLARMEAALKAKEADLEAQRERNDELLAVIEKQQTTREDYEDDFELEGGL